MFQARCIADKEEIPFGRDLGDRRGVAVRGRDAWRGRWHVLAGARGEVLAERGADLRPHRLDGPLRTRVATVGGVVEGGGDGVDSERVALADERVEAPGEAAAPDAPPPLPSPPCRVDARSESISVREAAPGLSITYLSERACSSSSAVISPFWADLIFRVSSVYRDSISPLSRSSCAPCLAFIACQKFVVLLCLEK